MTPAEIGPTLAGVLLLIVGLGILALFALAGVAFVVAAGRADRALDAARADTEDRARERESCHT